MKKSPLYSLKRFFSLLILDKDISEEKIEKESVHSREPEPAIHPIFLATQTVPEEERPFSIQPEEIGGIESIQTHVFWDDESISPLFEEEEFPITSVPKQTQEPTITHPEEDFYEYAMSDIPESVLSQEIPRQEELPVRKSEKFTSLRDVLIERGNFWQDKSKKVENIWDRDGVEMPEEEILIHDDMVVWDVLPMTIKEQPQAQEYDNTKKVSEKMPEYTGWSTLLGISEDGTDAITIDQESLRRHTLIVGQTGSGKSTLMERMILQDIDAWRGVGLIDPHGDLYDRIIHRIPKSRSNDVVLFDLADIEYPIGFNILENTHEQFPSLVASSIVGVFKKIFGYSWWPRLEYILRNATLTLLEKPGSTLLDLTLLLSDEDFREKYLKQIKNPFLQKFWSTEFDSMSQVRQAEVVSPILNKVGQFLSVPLIRNIVSQPQSGFSPRWVMDNRKIFLANLSKGKIGEDVSDMFGSMLVSKFQLDVMSRATIDPEKRVPFRLYVDEFQNFATESFADIFSEARKYNLELIIAHQYLGQVDKKLIEAILGNVGNIIAFHTSNEDAKILAPNMSKNLDISLLTEQQSFSFVMKTVKDGKKEVENGELLAPELVATHTWAQNPEKLQTLVREKFAKKREFVEGKLSNKIEQ